MNALKLSAVCQMDFTGPAKPSVVRNTRTAVIVQNADGLTVPFHGEALR
jgi:hypothetical protein